jgi:hypothetical protein
LSSGYAFVRGGVGGSAGRSLARDKVARALPPEMVQLEWLVKRGLAARAATPCPLVEMGLLEKVETVEAR